MELAIDEHRVDDFAAIVHRDVPEKLQIAGVTIDLDCLCVEEAVTNWESGRFTVADLEWALGKLRESSCIPGGDICGAYSPPKYARWKQGFAAEFDRPKLAPPNLEKARATNLATLEKLWPLLAGS